MSRTSLVSSLAIGAALVACGDNGKTVGFVDPTLDFGQTDCGATALPHVLVLNNPTSSAYTFMTSLALGSASPYTILPAAGEVLPGSQIELNVYSAAIPAISATTDNLYGDTLTITTDSAGDSPHQVAISQTAHGAIVTFGGSDVAFTTDMTIGTAPQTQAMTIANTGNASVAITPTSTNPAFTFTPGGPIMLAAAGNIPGQITYADDETGMVSGTISVDVTGPTCAPPPTLGASAIGNLHGTASAVAISLPAGRPNNSQPTICVLTTPGLVACTGTDSYGSRGAGSMIVSPGSYNTVFTADGVLDQVVQLTAGRSFFCARRQGGDVWCWGDYNGYGRRGAQSGLSLRNAFATKIADGTSTIAAGYAYTCTVVNGALSCGGLQQGNGAETGGWTATNVTAASVTGGGGYALLTDGTVLSFGLNTSGERGNGDPDDAPPSPVAGISNVTQIIAGGTGSVNRGSRHGCAIENDGSLWCWGRNSHGQLGTNDTTNRATAMQVTTDGTTPLANVKAAAASGSHTCAIADAVYCWGQNNRGQLGTGDTIQLNVATQTVPPITNATSLAVAGHTSCAVLATGGVRCWGQVLSQEILAPAPLAPFEP